MSFPSIADAAAELQDWLASTGYQVATSVGELTGEPAILLGLPRVSPQGLNLGADLSWSVLLVASGDTAGYLDELAGLLAAVTDLGLAYQLAEPTSVPTAEPGGSLPAYRLTTTQRITPRQETTP